MPDLPAATVLVADDSATVRALVRVELEASGYVVLEAEDGQSALTAAQAQPLDAILLDIEMPVMDGTQTIAALRADPATHDLPVVFLSSRSSGEDVVAALRLGAHDYLRKPLEPGELLARVHAAVEVSRLRAELRRRTEDLDRLSRTDHLTGLFNRRHLDEALHAVLASSRRHSFPVTVLLLDVDGFKGINDRCGHEAGDDVLKELAERLRRTVRVDDLIGRWGGEELIVLATHTDPSGAQILAERLRAAVGGASVRTAAGDVEVTVSVGGATARRPGSAPDQVLRVADEQLYAAKSAGRNCSRLALVDAAPG